MAINKKLVTEDNRPEAAIRNVNQAIHAFVDNCPHGIILLDLNGNVIEWNPAAETIFGWSKEEVIGRPNPIVPKERQEEYISLRRQVEEGMSYSGRKLQRQRKDGTPIYINMSSALLHDEKGKRMGVMGIAEDITQQIRAEEDAQILARLVDASPASITIHDFEGNFHYANKMTLDLHGFSREEFLATNLHDIDVPDSVELISARMKELREKGEAAFDVYHRRKDGSSFPLRVSAKVALWNDRPVVLSVASDISEQKKTEVSLRESRQFLQTIIETEPT